jgi:hypothetical protein
LGEPGAIGFGQPGDLNANTSEGVTHAEPDSTPGKENDPKANAPVNPEGTGSDILLVEEGTAGENVDIEGDGDPYVELQEPWVNHLVMPEEDKLLTLPSPPLCITLEAASMQHSPAVNTMTPEIPEPEVCGTDLKPLLHGMSPPPTSEVARTQRSPAVNAGTLAIPDPDGSKSTTWLDPGLLHAYLS